MASVARAEAEELTMLEEQVDTGLAALLENYRPPFSLSADKKDELGKRFLLQGTQALPEFTHAYAKAFKAEDGFNSQRNIYAMVCDNTLPYRLHAITEMNGFNNPYALSLYGAGTVNCSHLGESRMVLFIERPQGTKLSEVLSTQGRLHEHRVVDFILQPAVRALIAMREHKVSHGHIRPENIFMGESTMLGECYSAPCGSLSDYFYEPPERAACHPLARGEANEKSDVYALGVLAYEAIYGLDKLRGLPREEFTRLTRDLGTYHVFANNREFSDMYQDFFRGVLTDNPNERWGLDQLTQWLSGKRFNMIAPSAPKEASRALNFMGQNFFSRRALAHMFRTHWRDTAKELRSLRLDRWCEMSLHKPDMAERVERALRIGGDAATEKHTNDMLGRVIAILDPTGPIHTMSLSVRPDGIGTLLAALMKEPHSTELTQLLALIETDVSNYWADLDPFNKAYDHGQMLWKLTRVKTHLKNKAFGFGIERVLYDLNPSLPCQSDLLRQHHVTTLADALKALDAMAVNLAPDTSFMDRHLAAFIASKMDIGKEIRLNDLSTIPVLADNPELIVLRILAKSQQKHERLALVGLAAWAGMRVEKMLDEIHNRIMRRQFKQQLRKLASGGQLAEVLSAIVNRDMAQSDHEGFAQAIALHQINHARIERYQNIKTLEKRVNDMGGRLATMVSNTVLFITSIVVLTNIMGL